MRLWLGRPKVGTADTAASFKSALLQLSGHEVRHPFAGSLARFSGRILFGAHKSRWMSALAEVTNCGRNPRIALTDWGVVFVDEV